MLKKSKLEVNNGCKGCNKNCMFRGLTTAQGQERDSKYKCNK